MNNSKSYIGSPSSKALNRQNNVGRLRDSEVPRPAKHLQIKRRALRIILVSAFKPGITSVSPEGRGETEINDITLNQQAK